MYVNVLLDPNPRFDYRLVSVDIKRQYLQLILISDFTIIITQSCIGKDRGNICKFQNTQLQIDGRNSQIQGISGLWIVLVFEYVVT